LNWIELDPDLARVRDHDRFSRCSAVGMI